jgi:TusA-related sulfurtransferase
MPIANAAKQLNGMEAGQVLEVLADDEGILEDMPAWCNLTGNECLGVEEDGGEYKAYVRKAGKS